MVMHRWDEVLFAQSTSNAPIKNTASAEYREGLYPAFSATGQDVWLPTHRYEGRGIVVSAVGARCGKSFKADGKWSVVANTHALYVNEDIALRDYCWYALNNEEWWIKAGSGQPFVKLKDSLKRKHCFPPIEEQKQIVKVLDEVAQLISLRKEQLAKLDQLVKSRFIELFGDVIQNDRGWEQYTFSDIATSRLGKMLDAKQQTGKYAYPYLANFNVQWFRFEIDNLNKMDFNEADRQEFELRDGDLLVCEGGEIGRCAVWHNEIQPCYFQKALHRVRCNQRIVLPDYMAWWLKYNCDHKGFAAIEGAKATIAHLPGAKLKALKITVPPIELQNQFVAFIKQTDKSKLAIQQSLDKLELLKKSLMQEYFG